MTKKRSITGSFSVEGIANFNVTSEGEKLLKNFVSDLKRKGRIDIRDTKEKIDIFASPKFKKMPLRLVIENSEFKDLEGKIYYRRRVSDTHIILFYSL